MNKIQIRKMLATQITTIGQIDKDMALSRWQRSRAFAQIHSMVVWDKSPYKSFKDFVAEEFPDINPGSAYFWAINYTQITKWYTWTELQTISKSISYTRAVAAQQAWHNKRKVSITVFIKFAKSINTSVFRVKEGIPNPNRITLSLPVLYVDKFESILVPYGYIIPKDKNATKHGISDALVKYLDTI